MSVILYEYKEFEGVADALVKIPELEKVVMNNSYVIEYNSQQMPESFKYKFDSVVGRLLWYMYVANNVAFSLQYQKNTDIFTPEENAESYTVEEAMDKFLSFFYNIYTNNGTVFLGSDWLNLARDVQSFVLSKKPRGYEDGGTIANSTQHFRIMETDTPIYKEGGQIDTVFAKGGKVSDFDKLANKVAKQYSGKKVPSKYRSEYGKMYSPEEAQEVGRKVAYKVMMMQEGKKMAEGGMLWNDIYEKYPSSKYYMSRTQLQDWLPAKLTILEKTGEKTSSGRDIYKDNPVKTYVEKDRLWFEEYAKGGRTISIVNDGVKFDKSKYKAVYGDFDKDGTVNIDDANPLDATKKSKVEQVELKDTFDKLLSVKAELDDIMYDAVDTLDKKAPKDADIYARTKTPYSILKKLVEKRMLDPNKGLTDMIGTTIAVGNQKELEKVRDDIDGGLLGKVLDRDDYYKNPKAGYRAYHYIVEYDGVPVEVQLKTKRMKKLNEVSHDFYKKGTLDAKGLDAVSKTFEKADRGDKKALAEVKKLLSDKKALASKISTSKMAKGGAIKELRKEKDIDIYEDVMEMGGDVTDSQDLSIANADNLVMKKGGKTNKRKTGTKKPNSFFAVVKRNQKKGEAWKDAIQRVKREMAKK